MLNPSIVTVRGKRKQKWVDLFRHWGGWVRLVAGVGGLASSLGWVGSLRRWAGWVRFVAGLDGFV